MYVRVCNYMNKRSIPYSLSRTQYLFNTLLMRVRDSWKRKITFRHFKGQKNGLIFYSTFLLYVYFFEHYSVWATNLLMSPIYDF
jgi:hypothetical protein